jgi:hypothetical protein
MSAPGDSAAPLDSFDFLYMPSRDVVADLAFYRDVLGGEVVSRSRPSAPGSRRCG